MLRLNGGDYNRIIGKWDEKQPPLVEGGLLKHFLEDYRPQIPLQATIVFYAIKDAFKDPSKTFNALRPMLTVYWA